MAVAKPFRFLALISAGAVLYFIYLFYNSSGGDLRPSSADPGYKYRLDKSFREPNLDSMMPGITYNLNLMQCSNRRTSRPPSTS
jgi:hypothetical protein